MSSINRLRKLQILNFSKKKIGILKRLKKDGKICGPKPPFIHTTLVLFKKGVFVRDGCFSPQRDQILS